MIKLTCQIEEGILNGLYCCGMTSESSTCTNQVMHSLETFYFDKLSTKPKHIIGLGYSHFLWAFLKTRTAVNTLISPSLAKCPRADMILGIEEERVSCTVSS